MSGEGPVQERPAHPKSDAGAGFQTPGEADAPSEFITSAGSPSGQRLRAENLLAMQGKYGNRFVGRMLSHETRNPEAKALQRFGSDEHRQLGDQASDNATLDIDLGGGDKLTYGQMVALAGDFYGSIAEIRNLASTPAGQAELRWTRWFALHSGSEPPLDESAKTRIRDNYYRLAASNISHFSAGGTARTTYEQYHQEALGLAFMAGVTGNSAKFTDGMASEAFSNHFLTDMFSAGHVRTPRMEMKAWYEAHYSDSVTRFISFTSHWITSNLDKRGDIPFWLPNSSVEGEIQTKIRELGGSAVDSFSIGDIVSLAFHDHDNAGLGVISDVDPNGTTVEGGFHWTAKGDGHLADGEEGSDQSPVSRASITRQMTVAAMKVSINDLSLARELGMRAGNGTSLSDEQIETAMRAAINKIKPFGAERYIPREDPDAGNTQMNWHWGQLDDVLRSAVDNEVKTTIAGTLRGKASSISPPDGIKRISIPAEWLPGLGPEMAGGDIPVVELHVRSAFLDYCEFLGSQGIGALDQAMAAPAQPPAPDATLPDANAPDASVPDATVQHATP